MSLEALAAQLDAFVDGRLDREGLRRWLTPYQVAATPERAEDDPPIPWSPERDDEELFWQLVWALEDDSVDEGWHRDVAGRALRCLSQTGSSADTSELLPLIKARRRFCEVVAKHRAGIVSRMGLQSVIGKTFRFEQELCDRLKAATLSNLEALCARISTGDYIAAKTLLQLPPA